MMHPQTCPDCFALVSDINMTMHEKWHQHIYRQIDIAAGAA